MPKNNDAIVRLRVLVSKVGYRIRAMSRVHKLNVLHLQPRTVPGHRTVSPRRLD